ncbi:MAG TPA: T9SS type A sorting domain-containing protein [Bacteroidia bacterium]|nr:T9SS type A sorting domain-containing protein [Bacteroidia bacterium]
MKIFLLLSAILLPYFATGQNWSPPGATWFYGYSVWTDEGYYKIEYTGDTVISSITCKILRKTRYNHNLAFQTYNTTNAGTEYTYADNDKVYIYKHNQFYTLYDFSAPVGATWTVPEIQHYNACNTTGTIRVDSTGIMTINSMPLRYIDVSLADSSQTWGWHSRIVDLVGPVIAFGNYNYLFPVKFDACGMVMDELIEGGYLRCYSDSSFAYSTNISPACDYLTSTGDAISDPFEINIFPNPSSGSFTVAYSGVTVREIRLTDITGKIIFQRNTGNLSGLTLDNLSNGTYILAVTDIENRSINRKIICAR